MEKFKQNKVFMKKVFVGQLYMFCRLVVDNFIRVKEFYFVIDDRFGLSFYYVINEGKGKDFVGFLRQYFFLLVSVYSIFNVIKMVVI